MDHFQLFWFRNVQTVPFVFGLFHWWHTGIILELVLSTFTCGIRFPHTHCNKIHVLYYAVRVGAIYLLSGIGGSILSSLFIQRSISVGASGALFGLLGAMLSELLTNWTIYSNKVKAPITWLSLSINCILHALPWSFPSFLLLEKNREKGLNPFPWCTKLLILFSLDCGSFYTCCHHRNKFGSWDSSPCWQLCTHWWLHFWLSPWFCVALSPPVWLVRKPPSSSQCPSQVQIRSIPIRSLVGCSDFTDCWVSSISITNSLSTSIDKSNFLHLTFRTSCSAIQTAYSLSSIYITDANEKRKC